jgi:pSer/pThr/pTyr-binding forkhead associated (FHA) protein
MHRPRLEAFEGGTMVRSMMLTSQPTFLVGRDGAQADVVVMDATVSRQHAVIINSSSATFIQDLDSAHGTWYDESGRTLHVPRLGVKVGEDPVKLIEGSTLRFGSLKSTVFRVTGLEPQKVEKWQPPAWADVPARDCRLEVRSNTVSNPYLAHLDAGGDVEEVLPLRTRCTSFGRSAQHVDYVVKDDSVSRQHAAVVHSPDGESYLLDLGSSSGTYVEGRRVSEQVKLSDGVAFSLGTCKMTFTYRMAAPSGGKRKR